MAQDTWNPDQYEKFKQERYQPAYDLMDLVEPHPGMRVVDLGCGTGELTAELHGRLEGAVTTGIDLSPAMLEKASAYSADLGISRRGAEDAEVRRGASSLSFEVGNISDFCEPRCFDLIFSNAALQWVPDHPRLFRRLYESLKPGGQLAVQVPNNFDHPSQTVAVEMRVKEPYSEYLPAKAAGAVLEGEENVVLLHKLGFERINVRTQVYLHLLESRDAVVEWVKGTMLTDYQKALPAELYERFLGEYREALREKLEDLQPYPFTFKRILIHAVRG
jgi:trans-aconitate 2-methyltransferase